MIQDVSSLAMNGAPRFPCPVCGYFVFDEPPGSFAICPICFWEDDIVQLGFPLMAGGAMPLSLQNLRRLRMGLPSIAA
jgi:hypothetical protein